MAGDKLRYPAALWKPGPAWKTNAAPLVPRGVVGHSAVGFAAGLLTVLAGPDRASWHFSILYDGTVWQHYETDVQTWHAQAANAFTIGIEYEGGFDPEDEPLTPAQVKAGVALIRWLGQQHDFSLHREEPGRTLFEHNEFANKPCPSGRIPWEKYTEDDMADPRVDDLIAVLYGDSFDASDQEAADELRTNGGAVPVLKEVSRLLRAHLAAHDSGGTSPRRWKALLPAAEIEVREA